jgi:hypothetical protein
MNSDSVMASENKKTLLPPGVESLLVPIFWLLVSTLISFDSLLLHLGTHLSSGGASVTLSFWHLWWSWFGFGQSDGLAINAWSGAPFLSNHLGYMPIVQSIPFGLLQVFGNPVLSFNLILVLSLAATQYAVYRFLLSKDAPAWLAGLGATAFTLSGWFYQVVTQGDIILVGMWGLPLALLAWDNWLGKSGSVRGALVVFILYVSVLSGVQHFGWIVGLWLPYAVWTSRHLWRSGSNGGQDDTFTTTRDQLWLIGLFFAILVLIYPGPNVVRTLQGNEPAFAGSAGNILQAEGLVRSLVMAGPVVLLFAAITAAYAEGAREGRFWLGWGAACLLFALGLVPDPIQMVMGALDMPFQALYGSRIFMGSALFALITYSCIGWRAGWQRITDKKWVWAAVAGGLALILLANPAALRRYASGPVQNFSFYEEVSTEPEDYLLLTYPFGLVSSQNERSVGEHAELSLYAVWHHKRALSGVAPYYGPDIHESFEAMQFLYPEALVPEDMAGAAGDLGVAVRDWRIGYVVVHADLLSEETRNTIDELARQSESLCPAVVQDGLVIYRADWHPYEC